mmetsp:Transcript_30245/g.56497  ORF Transcript_30245/g.56497 Transcript_30245/m.56497 type:complete len:219 (+) Transcript_30245:47-703(+)
MRPACMAAGGWRRTSHVSARRGRPRTEVFLISFGRAPAACVVLRNANDRNGTKVYTEVHTHTRTHGYQLGATATYAKKERGSLATVLGSSNRGPSLLQQRKHRDAMFVLSRPSGPAMHLSTLILLPLLLRLVFWIPRVPGPVVISSGNPHVTLKPDNKAQGTEGDKNQQPTYPEGCVWRPSRSTSHCPRACRTGSGGGKRSLAQGTASHQNLWSWPWR